MYNIKIYCSSLEKRQNLLSDFLTRSNNIIWYNYVQWDSFTHELAIDNTVGRVYVDFKQHA